MGCGHHSLVTDPEAVGAPPAAASDVHRRSHAVQPELSFAAASAEDLAEILRIEVVSFPSPWSQALFAQELATSASRMWIARSGAAPPGPLVGYVCRSFAAGEMHILTIAVHPDHRRCGVGKRLLKTVIDEALEYPAGEIWLEVRETNYAAVSLYQSAGFVCVGSRPDYYGRGVNAVLMTLWTGSAR